MDSKINAATFWAQSLEDLINVIIPHFNKYNLLSRKKVDFKLFEIIVNMVINKNHLAKEGIEKIVYLRASH